MEGATVGTADVYVWAIDSARSVERPVGVPVDEEARACVDGSGVGVTRTTVVFQTVVV